MNLGGAMKDIPAVVWVCITVAFLAIVGSFVFLSSTGADATEFSRFLNSILNLVGALLGIGGLAFGASAAVNAKKAAEQTNGVLPEKVKEAAKEGIKEVINGNGTDNGRPAV